MALSWKRWLTWWKLRPAPSRRPRPRRTVPSLEALEDRTVLSTLIPVANHRDLVFDATRGLLDITTSSGTVQQFSVANQTLLTPLTVGNSLEGADIAPDGSALYVAEGQTASGQGVLHKVDLSTGAVTNSPYALAFYESGSFDVGIGAGGKGLFDGSFAGSGWVPLRQIDLASGTLSPRTDDPGSGGGGQVRQNTLIHRSADRSLFLFTESNISSGPLFTYNARTDTFSRSLSTNVFLDNAPSAVNRNGSLIAVTKNGAVTVMDSSFNVVRVLPYVTGGVTFDPVRDVLYAVNPNTGQIQAYDTNTWAMKYQMAIGESYSAAQAFGNGVMTTSSDGSLLFLATPSGVREYNLQVPTGNQFVVSGFPTSDSAGAAGSFTVTAEDAQGNVLTNYTGTVHFGSSDTTAQLPADYTFTAGDGGTHTFAATLVRAGVQTITATDTASNAVTGTEGNIVVTAGAVASIGFTSGVQGSYTAGGAVNLNLLAQDAYGNAASGYRGTVHFTSTDAQASLPSDYTFTAADGGNHSFTGFLKTAGTQSVSVADKAVSTLTATQSGLHVVPASTTAFSVTGYPATTAGVAQTFTVTSRDSYGNRTTLYSGTVHFTSSDLNAILPVNYAFTSADQGARTFSATLKSAGTQSLTVADTGAASIKGSETGITVSPAAPSRFFVSLSPDASTAGQALSLSMTAVDAYGNLATGYTGTVHFTSTDPQAALPADYTFTAADAGRHTFTNGVTLYTVQPPAANGQFVTATDTTTSSISGTGHDFVRPAAASAYQFSAPAAVAAGSPFSVTLTAVDPYGNRATGYTGTVHFSSSDPAAVLPADYTFISAGQGSHTFTAAVTLGALGTQTVTATDAANGAINATATTTVNPEVQGLHFTVSPSASTSTAGLPFGVTVTALDGNGNVASGYTGTVTFATSDSGARVSLPAPYTFSAADAGVHTFGSAILVTAGSQAITAYDQGITDGSSAGSASVQITPASARTFSVVGFPTPVTAGTAGTLTVTALDVYGNVATGYAGTVHFASSDASAALPADYTFTAADGGIHSFSATLKTAATQSIRASDTGPASMFGTETGITVVPASAARLAFTLQGPMTAGVAGTFMVTALDAYGNAATGYRGTVHFTSSDAQAGLPADYTWTAADNGQHAFSAALVLKTAGTQTVTATDVATSITGTTTQTVVAGPVVAVYATTNPQSFRSTAGQAFTISTAAEDAYGNVVTNFTGTIFWSSSDRQATLPGAYTFTTADKGVHNFVNATTLRTAGFQTATASWSSGQNSSTSSISDFVTSAAASRVQVAAPSSGKAGSPFTVTVTAFDPYGNAASGFTGTAHFTSSDPSATLPADYTFTSADAGVHTFTNGATLDTAGSQTVSVSAGGFNATASTKINPAAATHFLIAAPASSTAGSSFTATVAAVDAFGNVAAGYAGTVHFTSPDGGATLPADYAFTAADAGKHAFGVTLVTAGNQAVAAADAASASVSGSATVAVNPAAAVGFRLAAPPAATAGTPFSITVTALDAFGNTASGYLGTVHFASSDPGAALPADYAFTAGDGGTHTFANGVTLVTAGGQTVTVGAAGMASGAAGVAVTPAAAAGLSLAAPAAATAGAAFTVTLTARDAFGNVAAGYAGTVHFASPDGGATLPADYAFTAGDAGVHAFGVTLVTAGNQAVAATDSASSFTASASVGVGAAAASSLVVSAASSLVVSAPPSGTAGVGFTATVAALDAFGNVATGYAGTVHFASSDASAALPADYAFTAADAGRHAFSVTLVTAGNQSVAAADAASGSLSGSASVQVGAAAAVGFRLAAPSAATAGSASSVTVTALDAFGNTASGYLGTVHFASSDPGAALPADYAFTAGDGGTHTFANGVTLVTAGGQTVTVGAAGMASGTAGVAVTPAAAAGLSLAAPAAATAGAAFTVTLTARDAYGNVAAGYAGTVHFASPDGGAALPADYAFTSADAGVHAFGVTLVTAGNQAVTATDSASGSLSGSASVRVGAAAASSLTVSAPANTTAGSAFGVTVTARDRFGNTASGYAGTAHFSSSDGQAALPADYAFTVGDAGVHTFSATLKTAGNQSLAASDANDGSLTGSGTIEVASAAASKLAISAPAAATAGGSFAVTVTARDDYGNTATTYAGTVHFTSSDAGSGAAVPADYAFVSGDNGVHTFAGGVTFVTAGNRGFTATDATTSSIKGSATVSVSAAAASHYAVVAPTGVTAGTSSSVSVTALDAFNNVATSYAGTAHLTSTDSQAVLPADYVFMAADAGRHIFNLILKTAGTQSITATDTASSIAGSQPGILVAPAAAATLSVSGYPVSTTAGVAHTLTVTLRDAFGNVATGYTGTVHFAGSDPQAALPADYAFTAADAGRHTFSLTLKTAGSQSVTVRDSATSSLTGTQSGIAVNAAAAATLVVSGYPSPTTAGTAHAFTVTARDAYGNVATGYTGTVRFTTSDAKAGLPASYTFTATDAGVHAFSVTLKTAGTQTITAADTATGTIAGTESGISVTAAAATHFAIQIPTNVKVGVPFTITVVALDAFGNVATGYTGSVHFTSTDRKAFLPPDYTFMANDAGVHSFTVTMKTLGTQSITATDKKTGAIAGSGNTDVTR